MIEAIKEVLKGIDQTELESTDGWWETSAGAEFGAKKLKYILGLLAQPEQEPVAWVDPATLHHLKIGLEGVHLVYETEMVNSLPLYDKPQFQNPKQCLERLIRIMGTFDLATGHADTFDALLDSLESELRDVLGYYRQQRTWVGLTDEELELLNDCGDTDSYKFARAIEAKLKAKNI